MYKPNIRFTIYKLYLLKMLTSGVGQGLSSKNKYDNFYYQLF